MARQSTRPRLGGVYQRGARWWIRYQHRGEQRREPGGLDGRGARTKDEAEAKLRQRLAEVETGRYVGPAGDRLTVGGLLDDYLAHLEMKGAKGTAQTRCHLVAIRERFGTDRAVDVSTQRIREHIAARLAAGATPATVNRGLQAVRAALNLARKEGRFQAVPYFPLLRERNTRRGFFERAEHEAIRAKLPDPHRDVAEFGYRTGWRLGEILQLAWADVDGEAGCVYLAESKNDDPRTFPLRDEDGRLTELGDLVEQRRKLRAYGSGDTCGVSRYVFHVEGHRVWNFNRVWREAANAAKLPGRLFHDYRRTAARDLVRAGVPESVAMRITGHRTAAVFRRYNITSDRDKREAVSKLTGYRAAQRDQHNVVVHRASGDAS